MSRNCLSRRCIAVLAGMAAASAAPMASGQVFNLSADWSGATNPFGPWSLKKSPTHLFTTFWPNWSGNLPGWADAAASANAHVPVWIRMPFDAPNHYFNQPGQLLEGDIAFHGAELYRTGSDVTSVVWTAPASGEVEIVGAVWTASNFGRQMRWELRKNGVVLSDDLLISNVTDTRANPSTLDAGSGGPSATLQTVVTGDEIELAFISLGTGDFHGMNLEVRLTANRSPVADCNGPEIIVEADGPSGTLVTLDGRGSSDPDGDAVGYHWDVSDLSVTLDNPASDMPTGLFPIGVTKATLTVTDGNGGVAICDVKVTVQTPSEPPRLECTSDIAMLWPPDHTMRTVTVYILANDIIGAVAFETATVTIRSDEADDADGKGDGATTGDVDGADGFAAPINVASHFGFDPGYGAAGAWVGTVQLRAERAGSGDGRCYTVDVAAEDAFGREVVTSCCIVVPHDRRPE